MRRFRGKSGLSVSKRQRFGRHTYPDPSNPDLDKIVTITYLSGCEMGR